MILYPNAKINIGLNIVARRPDGFHDIETIFLPIRGLCDILEVKPMAAQTEDFVFTQTGLKVDGPLESNLCFRAYELFRREVVLPRVAIHLHKQIPFGAGLGGGSSDGAFTLVALNSMASTPLPPGHLKELALSLGSDCPFFVENRPCYATGRGDRLTPIDIDLKGYHLLLVNPGIHINTGRAYALSTPQPSIHKLTRSVNQGVGAWKDYIFNDFEKVVLELYPEIAGLKDMMYEMGAEYAAMSGSGSTVFGLFKSKPVYEDVFTGLFTFYQEIQEA